MTKYLFKNKKNIAIYTVLAIVIYIMVTRIYEMFGLITDVVEKNDYGRVREIIIMSIVILVALLFLAIYQVWVNRYILNNISNSLRSDLFDKVYELDYCNYSKRETTYYISMIANDVIMLEENYFAKIFDFINNIFELLVMLAAITMIGWKYLLITMVFLLAPLIQPFILKKKIAYEGVRSSEEIKNYTGVAQEMVNGFSTIKGVGNGANFMKRFNKATDKLEDTNLKLNNVKAYNSTLALLAVNILRVGGLLFFSNSAIKGFIDAAAVASLLGYINNVGNPIMMLLSHAEAISSTKDVRKKLLDFLNEAVVDVNKGKKIDRFSSIAFENVSFGYDDANKILDGLNISIEKGKKYAFIGESGCGKSTILKLLMGYYNNYDGQILFNNIDLKELSEESYKNNISYLTQKSYIYSDTFENNITLGNRSKTEDLDNIITKVQLDEVKENISSTEYNINDFSGGEKQRIALARALYAGKDVILMDEGTSALDNIKATEVEKNLLLDETKTVISIVHRFNESMKLYDKIYFIEDGHVAEAGSYDTLMMMNGKTSRLVLGKGNS